MLISKNAAFRSVDFIINTEASLRHFFIKMRRTPYGYKPSRAMCLTLRLLRKLQIGSLYLILPDGKSLKFLGKEAGPEAVLHIHNDRVVRRFMSKGKLGFCEAYLDGDWTSPDIATFFELILRNMDVMRKNLLGKGWYRRVSQFIHLLQPNSKRGSQKNIYRHYDIGNDFYKEWLDPSMTYSSALFKDGIDDIERAQDQKYQEMIDRLDLKPEHHVLEIGCGWGGFAEYAAKNVGCKITAITISQAQHDWAVQRIKDANLEDKVTIKLCDYRDLENLQFNRIASIEMFEAVGESYWPTFFNKLHEYLKPEGRAVLQIITIHDDHFENYRRSADYIQRYIFPGGMLPSMKALGQQIQKAGLHQGEHLSFGKDYARTLDIWNKNFQQAWPKIQGKFDERFKRLWEQYLCYCQAGFEVGTIDVIQIAIDKK